MALIPLFSRGILYDTTFRMVSLYQLVERFTIGEGRPESCVVVRIDRSDNGEYTYTLLRLLAPQYIQTRFIFDFESSEDGCRVHFDKPIFLPEARIKALCRRTEQLLPAEQRRFLLHATVVDYSERALAIFTGDRGDEEILLNIRAKRNFGLRLQGKRTAGWILPKARIHELDRVL